MKKIFLLLLVGVFSVSVATAAPIVLLTFVDYGDWYTQVQAVGGGTTINEESFGDALLFPGTVQAKDLVAMPGSVGSVLPNGSGGSYYDATVGNGATVTWNFNKGFWSWYVVGFGANYYMDPSTTPGLTFKAIPHGNTLYAPVTLDGSTVQTGAGSHIGETWVNGGFFGFVVEQRYDDDPYWGFSSVVIDANSATDTQHFGMDNIVYNPEPSTYLMFGTGLLGLVYALRRRKSA